jgi:hypothetical protein
MCHWDPVGRGDDRPAFLVCDPLCGFTLLSVLPIHVFLLVCWGLLFVAVLCMWSQVSVFSALDEKNSCLPLFSNC